MSKATYKPFPSGTCPGAWEEVMVEQEGTRPGASQEGSLEGVGLEADLEEVRPLCKAM